jgi:hypothetical protein
MANRVARYQDISLFLAGLLQETSLLTSELTHEKIHENSVL